MRVTTSFAILGLSAAVQPPTISLDLETAGVERYHKHRYSKFHKTTAKQPNGKDVFGRQDYTSYCQANRKGENLNCKLPKAQAYDHADGKKIKVRTSVWLVDLDKKATNTRLFTCNGCPVTDAAKKVKWTKRSTYLFKFDATDRAGNHAEQVVFGLILNDKVRPKISCAKSNMKCVPGNGKNSCTTEAAGGYQVSKSCGPTGGFDKQSGWKLGRCLATDNIDMTNTMTVRYTIEQKKKGFLCQNALYTTAVKKIDTTKKGTFIVTKSVYDHAGKYGINGKNNFIQRVDTVIVADTQKPHIHIKGANPARHECATTYLDSKVGGAIGDDALDTCANKGFLKMQVTNKVDQKNVGDYTVAYNTKDGSSNAAPQVKRTVNVRDATKPKLWLKGRPFETFYSGGYVHQGGDGKEGRHHVEASDKGVGYWDSCDKKLPLTYNVPQWKESKVSSLTRAWKPRFNDRKLGTYARTYKLKDASGNLNTKVFTVKVVDDKIPIVDVTGAEVMTFEATKDQQYKDQGAVCADYVDGPLPVVSSGDLVDLSDAGACYQKGGSGCKTYTISYDCQDTSGNKAKTMTRKVVVCDRTKPTIALLGAQKYYVEAGFPYVDAGATATDTLDGDVTKVIKKLGDTVNVRNAFYHRRSCADIKHNSKTTLKSGAYYITTLTASNQWARRLVHCNMQEKSPVTYYKCLNCKRVTPYAKQHGSCADRGFEMLKFTSKKHQAQVVRTYGRSWVPASPRATTDDYLCSTNDQAMNQANWPAFNPTQKYKDAKHDEIKRKENGKYVIKYFVRDCAGNRQTKVISRTVTVKDTLPPVITLTLKNKLIHTSYGGHKTPKSFQKVYLNPAGLKFNAAKKFGNPNLALMAETASVNGWMIGAVASAVAGVALLGFSQRETTQVPV